MADRHDTEALPFTDRALLASSTLVDMRTGADALGVRLSFSRVVRPMILAFSTGRCDTSPEGVKGCAPADHPMRWECCDYRRLSLAVQEMAQAARS